METIGGGDPHDGSKNFSQQRLHERLLALRHEHRDLDEALVKPSSTAIFDQLKRQRLKKRKLALKDEILRLEDRLIPDDIA